MSIIVYKNVQQIEGIEVGPPGKQLKCDRPDDGRPHTKQSGSQHATLAPRGLLGISVELQYGKIQKTSENNGSRMDQVGLQSQVVPRICTQAQTKHQALICP